MPELPEVETIRRQLASRIEGRVLSALRVADGRWCLPLPAAEIEGAVSGRRAPVKAFLLDQASVAGVGNIYADEALFRARIHPLRPAGSLRARQVEALRDAVVATLEAGIAAGGATIDDFRHADGVRGAFQDEFLVHRRAGEPCPRCGTPVRKMIAGGRATYACERCQPRPRRRA